MSGLTDSLKQLWQTRDELSLGNIRKSYLGYFLVLPFLLALINMQNNYLRSAETLFGLDALTLMYASYCVGIVMFILLPSSLWDVVSRSFAVISLLSLIAYAVLFKGPASLLLLLICWIGLGVCTAYAIHVFVFVLNNTERLTAILLAVIAHGTFMCLVGQGITSLFLSRVLPVLLMAASAVCIFSLNRQSLAAIPEKSEAPPHPGIRLSVPFFAVAFVIDSASSFVFTHDSLSLIWINGLGVFVAVGLALALQLIFRQSVWHMWNLFLILAFLSHVFVLFDSVVLHQIAFFLHGTIYVGYVATCYTLGGINKKYSSLQGFRKNLFFLFAVLLPSLIVLGLIEAQWPEVMSIVTAISCGALLFAFFLLTPLFQRYFFTPEWIDDYHRIDMLSFEETEALAEIGRQGMLAQLLTPEETDVAMLLIEGTTRHSISRKLHVSGADVSARIEAIRDKIIRKSDANPGIAVAVVACKLTRRETDVLRCLCQNMTNAQIATDLVLSEETVKVHIRNLMRKLPVENRQQVATWIKSL